MKFLEARDAQPVSYFPVKRASERGQFWRWKKEQKRHAQT